MPVVLAGFLTAATSAVYVFLAGAAGKQVYQDMDQKRQQQPSAVVSERVEFLSQEKVLEESRKISQETWR